MFTEFLKSKHEVNFAQKKYADSNDYSFNFTH